MGGRPSEEIDEWRDEDVQPNCDDTSGACFEQGNRHRHGDSLEETQERSETHGASDELANVGQRRVEDRRWRRLGPGKWPREAIDEWKDDVW